MLQDYFSASSEKLQMYLLVSKPCFYLEVTSISCVLSFPLFVRCFAARASPSQREVHSLHGLQITVPRSCAKEERSHVSLSAFRRLSSNNPRGFPPLRDLLPRAIRIRRVLEANLVQFA